MIEGMKFHIKGEELRDLLAKRSAWHNVRADNLKVNLKQAEDGMHAAAVAAASAGSPNSIKFGRVSGDLEIASTYVPRRSYGGNIEDPVAAIQQAILFHTNRAVALAFYAKHLIVDATYVLTESEVLKYELVAEVSSIEET